MTTISWDDFMKVELRVGTVVEARVFEEARRPAYRMVIDFGADIGLRKSSAQITDHYAPDELVGRQIMAVVNFPPKQIGPMMSECLVTGFVQDDGSVVVPGGFPVHDLVDLGVHLTSDEVTTVNGLLHEHLGRIPEAGDRVEIAGVGLEAVTVRRRAAERVRIVVPPQDVPDEPAAD